MSQALNQSDFASGEVEVEIAVVMGTATMRIDQLLRLGRGAVIELEQKTSDPASVLTNGVLVAIGDVVVTSRDRMGVSITELVKKS